MEVSMAEQHDFINIYIQHLVKEVEELTKTKIMGAAREAFKDVEIGELKDKVEELEASAVKDREEVVKTWQTALGEKDTEIEKINETTTQLRRRLDVKTNEYNDAITQIEGLKKELENKTNELKSSLEVKKGVDSKEAPKKGKEKKAVSTALLLE
jgi:chromosome segregation ATPase